MSTFAEIQSLIASSGSTTVDLADDAATLSLAQVQMLIAQGVVFASGDIISVEDTANTIEALSGEDIAALKALGADEVIATDRGLTLSLTQINALADRDVAAYSQYETMSATKPDDRLVGGATAGDPAGEQILALADGSYVVVYRNYMNGSGSAIYLQRYDAGGNAIGDATLVSGAGRNTESQASVTTLADGGYLVAWAHNYSAIHVQRYGADGEAVGDVTAIIPAISTTDGDVMISVPQVTALSDGGYIVTTYQSNFDTQIVAQRFDANGTAMGDAITLTTTVYFPSSGWGYDEGTELTQTIELANGNVMIVFSSPDASIAGVFAQIIDSSGEAVGSAFGINTIEAGSQRFPKISQLSYGGFAIAWRSANSVALRIFDDEGNAITSEITVSASSNQQENINITALEGGSFVITWEWLGEDNPTSTSGQHSGVYSQIFDAGGNALTAITLVNTTVVGSQFDPQIVALEGGGYVIVWSEYIETSGDGYEINAQVFDSDGNKIGGELEINTGESGNQQYQKITALEDGGFAITWYDSSTSEYYTRVFHNDTEAASFTDTAATISALTAADAADFAELGVAAITVSDGGVVTLSKAVAVELAAIPGIVIEGAASVTVTGSGASLDDLSVGEIATLSGMGVTGVDLTDDKATLSFDQAVAYVDAGFTFGSGDTITIRCSFAELSSMVLYQAEGFEAMGVKVFDLDENAVSFALFQIEILRTYGFKLGSSDVVTLTDSQLAVTDLTAAEIASLGAWGVTQIDLTDDANSTPTVLTLAQAEAFISAGMTFATANNVVVSDGAGAIAALDADDIAAFAAIGVDKVIASGTLDINLSQFEAYVGNRIVIDAGIEDVRLADTGASLAALSASQIARLADFDIKSLDATDDAVFLTFAQLEAYQVAGASFDGGDVITLSLGASGLGAITAADLAAAAAFGVAAIGTSSAMLDVTIAQLALVKTAGLAFGGGFTVRVNDTAANLLALSAADLTAYRALGLDDLRLADTGSVIAAMTIGSINALHDLGVKAIDVTNGTAIMSLAKANQFAASEMVFEGADTVIVTASSVTFADPDAIDTPSLQSINVDKIDASDNTLTLSLSGALTYFDAGIGFVAEDAVTVKLTLAEAKTISKATGAKLHASGVDRIEIDMTAAEVKALTFDQLQVFLANGIDGITNVKVLTFANVRYDLVTHTANYNPVIASNGGGPSAAISVAENTTAVTTVKATDGNAGSTLTYSIIGGVDQGLFTINARTGLLSFRTAPDFESPTDTGKDNLYDVTVRVSDGQLTDTQTIRIKVTDVKGYSFTGTSSADKLTGSPEHDFLDGKGGADTMYGGLGNDVYYVDNAGDRVFEAADQGTDTVYTTVSHTLAAGQHIELLATNLLAGTNAINLTGNELAQRINGNNGANVVNGGGGNDVLAGYGGNDRLNGGTGADQMHGGLGNDVFYVDNAGDRAFEAADQGTDTVYTTVSYTLAAGQHIELLATTRLAGTDAINLTGNELAQRINGNNGANIINGGGGNDVLAGYGGNDRLNGGTGVDQMHGGLGNDVYYVDNAGDRLFEAANQGTDTVYATVSYTLAAGQHIELLATSLLAGTNAINLTGNELAQRINGNNGANVVNGGGGDDVLLGYGGNDVIYGGTGNDVLYGGAGNDTLTGGTGYDYFVFDTALNTVTNVDRITDFNAAQDTIRLDNAVMPGLGATLGTLSAANFWKSTTGLAHDADDRIIYQTGTGKLFYDANGIAAGGAVHFATLAPNLALTHADFQVI